MVTSDIKTLIARQDLLQETADSSVIPDLVKIMQSIDTTAQEATLNESCMKDNKGRIIEY